MHPPPLPGRSPRVTRATPRPIAVHEAAATARPRLAHATLKLHVFAVLVSIYEQHPGLVSRAYLAGIAEDTDVAILDLCSAGLWACTIDGYVIADDEVRRIARIVHDQVSDGSPDH